MRPRNQQLVEATGIESNRMGLILTACAALGRAQQIPGENLDWNVMGDGYAWIDV